MRVVLDTNVLVSALIVKRHPPALLIDAWLEGGFNLLISRDQLDEIIRVTRYPRILRRIRRAEAGTLINFLRTSTPLLPLLLPVENLPAVEQSPDATDDKLLALAWAGKAEYLVTGDKSDLPGRLYERRPPGKWIADRLARCL